MCFNLSKRFTSIAIQLVCNESNRATVLGLVCSCGWWSLLLNSLSFCGFCRVEKKERARLKTVKFNAKSRDRGVSPAENRPRRCLFCSWIRTFWSHRTVHVPSSLWFLSRTDQMFQRWKVYSDHISSCSSGFYLLHDHWLFASSRVDLKCLSCCHLISPPTND